MKVMSANTLTLGPGGLRALAPAVNNPRRPRLVGVVGTAKDVSNEDMVVRRIGDMDVLAIGVQPCGERGVPGLALWDVSSPRVPRELAFFETPGGVHELDLVVRNDGRTLALLAVPFAEFENVYFDAGVGGDSRIVDVTNPSAPVELATWGIIADSNLEIADRT